METLVSKQKKLNKVDDKKVQEEIHRAIRKLVAVYPNWREE